MAEIDLSGKVAIVTGGGRGLGRVMTLSLLEAGAHVCAAMHIAQDIEGLRGEAKARGAADRLNAVVADIRDAQACQNVVAECNATFGPACILVNNAGINRPEPFEEVSEENFETVMDLNVKSAFFVAQSVVRGMIQAGRGGSVINMSSQMGHVGGRGRTVYCATKHAMEGLSKAMSLKMILGSFLIKSATL